MRIAIRWQLAGLIFLSSLIVLAVVTITIWVTTREFVLDVRSSRLSSTASLKAAQLSSTLLLVRTSVRSVTTRVLIQSALELYNYGNITSGNWVDAQNALFAALDGGQPDGMLMQAVVYAKNDTGFNGSNVLVRATATGLTNQVLLPYSAPNGDEVYLGDAGSDYIGYPSNLYPNLTYSSGPANSAGNQDVASFGNQSLSLDSVLLFGPWAVNRSCSLISLTMPVISNTSQTDVLGFVTVVVNASLLTQAVSSPEGLENTGVTLVIGPNNVTNQFPPGVLYNEAAEDPPPDLDVRFVLVPNTTVGRHGPYQFGSGQTTFDYSDYPAVKKALTQNTGKADNVGAVISTKNEEGDHVAVGYAMVNSDFADWLVLVEQGHSEVWAPIVRLRNLLIACVFGTAGALIIFCLPIAHYSSIPIIRLRVAARNSVVPPGCSEEQSQVASISPGNFEKGFAGTSYRDGFFAWISSLRRRHKETAPGDENTSQGHPFRIPQKVKESKHFIQDELTDLTETFNEMVDELMKQYTRLEERVQQRTAELELSKKAAEEANEAKTLFVANISHELKTPLNGMIGIAQTAQAETNIAQLKKDMRSICSHGDLLLKLIEDLLLFSKNQVGHSITLERIEFSVRNLSAQLSGLFDKTAQERGINLHVQCEGPADTNSAELRGASDQKEWAPFGASRVEDMVLWGDITRILQVVINFTSNSLKFTPGGGSVLVTIRCVGDADAPVNQETSSVLAKRKSDASDFSSLRKLDTANHINAMEKQTALSGPSVARRPSSSPVGAKDLLFEFEVQDTGPGVPEALQKRIFEPFFQGDMQLSKKYSGTGLGLSICSQLATLMGGAIALTSEEGQGSTFTMRIPLKCVGTSSSSACPSRAPSTASAAERVASPTSSFSSSRPPPKDASSTRSFPATTSSEHTTSHENTSPGRPEGFPNASTNAANPGDPTSSKTSRLESALFGRQPKVLIAEDNRANQMVAARMLKLQKVHDVDIAEDGIEAVTKVEQSMTGHTPYDLIFMDVQMPNMDGLEATRRIRAAGFINPIVALSAYSDDTNIKGCKEAGMNDFVSKPIQIPRLKMVLQTYCPRIYEKVDSQPTVHTPSAPSTSIQPSLSPPKPKGTSISITSVEKSAADPPL